MDTVFYHFLVILCLVFCVAVRSEDEEASGPSPESLRRYLSLRRLERLKAARYYAENGPQYLLPGQEVPASGNGQLGLNGESEGVPLGDRVNLQWRGRGQPEVFMGGDLPEVQPVMQGDDRGVSVDVVPSGNDENGVSPSSLHTRADDENIEEQKKSQQQTSPDNRFPASIQVSGEPLTQRRTAEPVEPKNKNPFGDIYFVVIVAGCSAAAIFGVVAAGYCFYRFQKNSKAAAEVDYPAYGVTGPNKDQTSPNGDRRLAQSAQMYHYQHQKQQMIAVEKATTARNTSASDIDSEEENEEGDYTVYECPGLAPTGEMEVKNPLFHDDTTPMSPPVVAKDSKKP